MLAVRKTDLQKLVDYKPAMLCLIWGIRPKLCRATAFPRDPQIRVNLYFSSRLHWFAYVSQSGSSVKNCCTQVDYSVAIPT